MSNILIMELFFNIPQWAMGMITKVSYHAPRADELYDEDMLRRLWDGVAHPLTEDQADHASWGSANYKRDENGKWTIVAENFDTSG
jgi:hypothetical protein